MNCRKLKTGVFPAGIQGSVFSLSNVLIQSSINSFGSAVMAGNGAAASIEGFIYVAMNSIHHAALSFTGQNLGAGNIKRIKRIFVYCLLLVIAIGLLLGTLALVFGRSLLSIYESDPNIISYGMIRLRIICMTYFLCGIMDVLVGSIRGMGYSIMPMIVSLLGACGLRVVWIYTVFTTYRTLESIYISYPVTWAITVLAHFVCFMVGYKRICKLNR
jgi:Na+-driven multidrug efflux pump